MMKTILLVEDDDDNRASVSQILEKENFRVFEAKDGFQALDLFRKEEVDLVLTDFKMPRMDGMELLKACRAINPDIEVVMMTAHGTIETAVEAMREGAYDFIPKPFKRITLLRTLEKSFEKRALVKENIRLREELERYHSQHELIGSSAPMLHLQELIEQVAPSSATVLIEGESGTGKELVAEAIHRKSPRRRAPFVKLSCAAIPETLLEAELFGYEKGAFTGAVARKEGRFELASEGTLFLDEIGELSQAVQVKLLRVLQEGEFERLGGTRTLRSNVRIIAATHRDLEEEVRQKRFREDLFYRINVVRIHVPALRERRDDIPILLNHFLKLYAAKNHKSIQHFDDAALETLNSYGWPGNVRELENLVERSVVLAKSSIVGLSDLPTLSKSKPQIQGNQISIPIGMPLDEVERVLIEETLKRSNGDKTLAARLLGITARTIYRKLDSN